jgi:hypothetical protein
MKKVLALRNSDACGARRMAAWDGALTHKFKWSHCYFFSAVVIGM